MKILELSELSESLESQYAALNWLDGDYPQTAEFTRQLRDLGFPFSDYQAVVAVDEGQVLGRIETVVLPFVTPAGTQPVLGVTGVTSRPDVLGRGVATTLMKAVHARERTTDRKWAFLWTHRSWGAHRLYENLGYRDVYSPPAALRRLPRRPIPGLPPRYGWRGLRKTEANTLEQLLRVGTRGRYGFIPRFPGSFRVRFRFGWRQPSDYRVLTKDDVPVGYAHTSSSPYALAAYEVVVTHPRHAAAALGGLERQAAGRWLVLGRTTFILDHEALLRKRGYAIYRQSHPTLMVRPLRSAYRPPRSEVPAVVCRTPEFSFHGGDVF